MVAEGGDPAPAGERPGMDSEREPDVNIGAGSPDEFACSDEQPAVGEVTPDRNDVDGNLADGKVEVVYDPVAERERDLRNDVMERERRLRDLVTEVGFAGTFAAMAGLARRWAEHPEVDARAAAELRLLGRRLDALVQDVGTSTRLA